MDWRAFSVAWLGFALASAIAPTTPQKVRLPSVVLWAWERTEDLRFLKPGEAGVAFLARTIEVDRKALKVRSRRNPLHVPPGTPLVAVVRVESRRLDSLTGKSEAMVATLRDLWHLPGVVGLQIDFDATRSQRSFYRDLLHRLQQTKPPGMTLTITALGSWCLGDPWIRDLPVDEAIPMLFQMGPDSLAVKDALARGGDFTVKLARSSVGYSVDEPFVPVPSGRRVYAFNPRAWTEGDFHALKARLGR